METNEMNNRAQFIYSELHSKQYSVTCIALIVATLILFGVLAITLCLYLSKPICPNICFRQSISIVFTVALAVVASCIVIAYAFKKYYEYKKYLIDELRQIESEQQKRIDADKAYERMKESEKESEKKKKESADFESRMLNNKHLKDYIKHAEETVSREQFEKLIVNREFLVTFAAIFNE